MNHDKPRQRKDGTWGYTTLNSRDEYPHAIGYCTPFREFTDDTIRMAFAGDMDRYNLYIESRRKANEEGKYHDGGHKTYEEACECYKSYLIDHDLSFHEDDPQAVQLHRCEVEGCSEFTSGSGGCGAFYGHTWHLCKTHRTRGAVASILTVGESHHS